MMNTCLFTHSAVEVTETKGSWVETKDKERKYQAVKIIQQIKHRWNENIKRIVRKQVYSDYI
jgi:hypothetical protein